MVTGCWESFGHAVHLTLPSYYGLNGQSTLHGRTRLGASCLTEKQEMDVAGTHVPAQQPNSSLSSIVEVHCFILTAIYNL